jgi:hypothetical protein
MLKLLSGGLLQEIQLLEPVPGLVLRCHVV